MDRNSLNKIKTLTFSFKNMYSQHDREIYFEHFYEKNFLSQNKTWYENN